MGEFLETKFFEEIFSTGAVVKTAAIPVGGAQVQPFSPAQLPEQLFLSQHFFLCVAEFFLQQSWFFGTVFFVCVCA